MGPAPRDPLRRQALEPDVPAGLVEPAKVCPFRSAGVRLLRALAVRFKPGGTAGQERPGETVGAVFHLQLRPGWLWTDPGRLRADRVLGPGTGVRPAGRARPAGGPGYPAGAGPRGRSPAPH